MATRIREKAKVRKETADKRPRATARYVRISSRKVKIVIDLIRGKQVLYLIERETIYESRNGL